MRTRIRTVKPEMRHDERYARLSYPARELFNGLITMADDEGRFRAPVSAILGHVFPYDEDAPRKLREWVREVRDSGMVLFYMHEDIPYGAFRHWKRHQKINRPNPSILPCPPDETVVEENRAEPYDASGNFKKTAIPERVRRAVAKAAGAKPGETTKAPCHWCGREGSIVWARLADGRPGSWVSFGDLELDHVVPEFSGGATDESNLVLACQECNRRRGHRHGDDTEERDHTSRSSVSTDHGSSHARVRVPIRSLTTDNVQGEGENHAGALCRLLADLIVARDPKLRQKVRPESDLWLREMRLLIDRDERAPGEVERAVRWSQASGFWAPNILSPGKLRKQFPVIWGQMQRSEVSGSSHLPEHLRPSEEWQRQVAEHLESQR